MVRPAGKDLVGRVSAVVRAPQGYQYQVDVRGEVRRYQEEALVLVEGDPGDRYYLIREGQADVLIAGRRVRRLGPGAGFGELALITGKPRTATVLAATDLVLGALGRAEFGWLVRESGETVGEFRARTAHYVGSAGLGQAVGGA